MYKKSDLFMVAKGQSISNGVTRLVVTGLGSGYVPVAPGTAGSLLGFLIFWLVKSHLYIYGLILILILLLGFIFIPQGEEKIFKKKDERKIVLDEIFGMLFCFWGIIFKDIILAIIGFLIFRLLDILKPPPARYLEKLNGAPGVMLDDFVVGIYTNLILRIILPFFK